MPGLKRAFQSVLLPIAPLDIRHELTGKEPKTGLQERKAEWKEYAIFPQSELLSGPQRDLFK